MGEGKGSNIISVIAGVTAYLGGGGCGGTT
jgi:hypothetical protein